MKKFSLIFLLLFLTGCTAAAVAPLALSAAAMAAQGFIMWKNGEATKYYNGDMDTLHRATIHAAATLGIKITNDDGKDKPSTKGYNLKAGEKDKLKISISPAEQNITKVQIRVNFMGDKPYAELFYKAIDDQLNIINFNQGKPVKNKAQYLKRLRYSRNHVNPVFVDLNQ